MASVPSAQLVPRDIYHNRYGGRYRETAMSVNKTVKEIREQLKTIKQAVAGIEFRVSQLESLSQAPEATLQTKGEA